MADQAIRKQARDIHHSSCVFDGHQEVLDEFIYRFIVGEQEILHGSRSAFDEVYLPVLRQEGVKFVALSVGGDHVAQVMYSASEHRFWDVHKKIDALLTEEELGCSSFRICRTNDDIDRVLSTDAIGLFLGIAGGRPLEGKKNLSLISSLRSLYRGGLRTVQLTGNSRNRLADGVGQGRTRGGLTGFGLKVVREADRLGMVIDTAQLSDAGFYDLIDQTDSILIDSHSCAAAVCRHPRNISDERIRLIAERGGVVGVSFLADLVDRENPEPGLQDLIRHIDHIADLAGIDHVAIGPDYAAYRTPADRNLVRGYGNRGPCFGAFDKLTPFQSEKYPGTVEGVPYRRRKSDYILEAGTHEELPSVTSALLESGYAVEDREKILGGNLLRVYRNILPWE